MVRRRDSTDRGARRGTREGRAGREQNPAGQTPRQYHAGREARLTAAHGTPKIVHVRTSPPVDSCINTANTVETRSDRIKLPYTATFPCIDAQKFVHCCKAVAIGCETIDNKFRCCHCAGAIALVTVLAVMKDKNRTGPRLGQRASRDHLRARLTHL